MATDSRLDPWTAGASYERYMGRWSRAIAREFVDWLGLRAGLDWLDVGCGTGALSSTIIERAAPRSVVGIDPSEGFVAHARRAHADARARFETGAVGALPVSDGSVDVAVSALAYNFFPDRAAALREMCRAARPGGTVALYVWDYPGGGMGFMDAFWAAALATDPGAAEVVEARRFDFCTPEGLLAEFKAAGMAGADVRGIEVRARFADFDDFWLPFTLGTGPAPGYYLSLDEGRRRVLRERLRADLETGGPIEFPARAWAIKGRTP